MFRLFAIISFLAIALAYHVNPVNNNDSSSSSSSSSSGSGEFLNTTSNETGPFVKIDDSFYYIETTLLKNWYDAYQTCNTLDSNLVAFETLEEWEEVTTYLIAHNLDTAYYWTAGIDLASWGTHVWFSNNQTISKKLYFEGEPNNARSIEHCDTMGFKTTPPRYGLNDEQCEYPFRYICETSEVNWDRLTKYSILTEYSKIQL